LGHRFFCMIEPMGAAGNSKLRTRCH
jgi:hypothetical protein